MQIHKMLPTITINVHIKRRGTEAQYYTQVILTSNENLTCTH